MAYSNAPGLIAAALVMHVFVLLSVVLRFISRRKHKLGNSVSDWLIVPPTIFSTGLVVLQVFGVSHGVLGTPLAPRLREHPDLIFELKLTYRQYEYASVITSLVTTGLIKISISFFYLRIFSPQKYRRVIVPWICILVLWTVGFLIAHLTLCGRRGTIASAPFINPVTIKRYCGNGVAMGYGLVISSAITDLVTVLLPVPMVLSLQLALHQKISLVAVFLIGLLSVGASTARAYIYIAASLAVTHTDFAISITSLCVWNLIEIQMGIIAACAPTLRPVLHDVLTSQAFSSLRSSASNIFDGSTMRLKTSAISKSFKSSLSLSEQGAEKSQWADVDSNITAPRSLQIYRAVTVDCYDEERLAK